VLVLWLTHIIPALRKLRQEKEEFEARLEYITKSCLKQIKKFQGLRE
jgi:hypothetical protein